MRILKVLGILGMCFSVLALSGWVGSKERPSFHDPGELGPYEVGFTSFLLTDTSRNPEIGGRPIPVYLWYPVDPVDITASTPEAVYPLDPVQNMVPSSTSSEWETYGFDRAYQEPPPSSDAPFPLVVYSPGWGAHAFAHVFVGTRLASHGIVVAIAYHWGDAWWPWEPFDHLATASMNRPRDISYMLTDLLASNTNQGSLLYGLVRPDQVAASGWSLGGYAAMVLAGGDDLVCDKFPELGVPDPPAETCVPSPPDPRISAIFPMDGSTQVLYFDEMTRITVPTMGIGQEWSTLYVNFGPDFASWQARLHSASQGHPCYRADLAEAYHSSFCNICEIAFILFDKGIIDEITRDAMAGFGCSAPLPTPLGYQLATKYMIAFLKTHLAGEQGYQSMLTPGHALKEPYIEFFVTEKRNPRAIDEDWPDDFWYFMHQPGSAHAKAAKDPAQSLPIPHMGIPR